MSESAPFGRGRLRRLVGLDRTGPKPRQTRKGEPLNPWTIPNLVGYLRLAALPLFLYLAYESGDGRSASAAIVFWLIAASDYLDGFLARVTGQYSRMGALLDPLVDRLTILSGAVVCWSFELLPRWALLLLALRELVMLFLAQYGLRHGVDIEVNWPGRVSVFPIMGGIFFAMVFAGWVPTALLIVGLALAIVATVLYARTGLRAVRDARKLQAKPHSP
jgi:cardiolipin synthase (CMP-forming)